MGNVKTLDKRRMIFSFAVFLGIFAVVLIIIIGVITGNKPLNSISSDPFAPASMTPTQPSTQIPLSATPVAFRPSVPVGPVPMNGFSQNSNVGMQMGQMASPMQPAGFTPQAACPLQPVGFVPQTTTPKSALPIVEAHWQGLSAISLTHGLIRALHITNNARGVVIHDVMAPATASGFRPGDLVQSIRGMPTPNLDQFVAAIDRVRDADRTVISVMRKGRPTNLVLSSGQGRLGNAVAETAPPIDKGSHPRHGYRGPCTECHQVVASTVTTHPQTGGANGAGAPKPQTNQVGGAAGTKIAPPIRAGMAPPHGNRGECGMCHTIIK